MVNSHAAHTAQMDQHMHGFFYPIMQPSAKSLHKGQQYKQTLQLLMNYAVPSFVKVLETMEQQLVTITQAPCTRTLRS